MTKKQQKKIVIGFVGQICSGKGSAVAYLAKKHQAKIVMFSQSLRDILERIYLPINRENMQKTSLMLRQTFGQDILSQIVAQEIITKPGQLVGLDGIRRLPELKAFKGKFSFYLVYVEAETKIRWQRLLARKQNAGDTKVSWQKFLKQQQAEADRDIVSLKKKANFVITNNTTPKEFKQKIEDILIKIKAC